MNEEKEKVEEMSAEVEGESEIAETAAAAAGTPHQASLQNDCHLPGREHSSLPALATNVHTGTFASRVAPHEGKGACGRRIHGEGFPEIKRGGETWVRGTSLTSAQLQQAQYGHKTITVRKEFLS